EARHVAAMATAGHAHAAVLRALDDLAVDAEVRACIAGAGPFPDVAGDVVQAVSIDAESTPRLRRHVASFARIALPIGGDPAGRWIFRVSFHNRQCVIPEPLSCGEGPLLIRRQAPAFAGLLGEPAGVGDGVVEADAGDRQIARPLR